MPAPVKSNKGFAISGTRFDAPALIEGLYVVATPIGNLRDISLRALETLAAADLVLCEDTRQSARLLDHYAISTSKQSLHQHNERAKSASIVEKISSGQAVALICDAGTPLISDPGFPLVRAVREAGLDLFTLPGASALLAGLTISGLPTDSFTFIGFLPAKSSGRAKALEGLSSNTETLVFYESPRRLTAALESMRKVFGDNREATVSLELTKKFERTHAGSMGELVDFFASTPARGEVVIIVSGAAEPDEEDPDVWQEALRQSLKNQPLRMAVDDITATYSLRRKQVYDAALKLKQ